MFQKTFDEGAPRPTLFDGFTENARLVLAYSNEEAERLGHNYIGTEHMLLALMRAPEGLGVMVLRGRGLNRDLIRAEVEKDMGADQHAELVPSFPVKPLIHIALESAIHEARVLNHDYIGTEHLLLGLLGARGSIAARALTNLGFQLDAARNDVRKIVSEVGFVHPERERRK